jgi:hypothetical protein
MSVEIDFVKLLTIKIYQIALDFSKEQPFFVFSRHARLEFPWNKRSDRWLEEVRSHMKPWHMAQTCRRTCCWCLCRHVQNEPCNVAHATLYSGNCGGQNNSSVVAAVFIVTLLVGVSQMRQFAISYYTRASPGVGFWTIRSSKEKEENKWTNIFSSWLDPTCMLE